MGRLEELIESRPDFVALGNEWYVGRYEISCGWIRPLDPDESPESGGVRAFFPLQDPVLFSSFVRLGARGEPTESKILRWVHEYGLLTLAHEGKKGVVDGLLNQAAMPIDKFRAEVMQARNAMLLYHDLRRADSAGLQERLVVMREHPTSQHPGPLSDMNRPLVSLYANLEKKFNWPLLISVRNVLEGSVEQKISSVRPSFWNMAPETTKATGELTAFTNEYAPTQSWRFPDLLSAVYLQFYLIMVNAAPLRICEHPNCRTPFPANRKDKRFCTDTCRSGARRYA